MFVLVPSHLGSLDKGCKMIVVVVVYSPVEHEYTTTGSSFFNTVEDNRRLETERWPPLKSINRNPT